MDNSGVYMRRLTPPNKKEQSILRRLHIEEAKAVELTHQLNDLADELKSVQKEVASISNVIAVQTGRANAETLDSYRY